MMKFTPYASGSTGNIYDLTDGKTSLIIECGLPYKEMQRLLPKGPASYDACLLSHEHGDHAKGAWDLIKRGTPVKCSKGTANAIGMTSRSGDIIRSGGKHWIGTMLVEPFMAEHDAAEPLGFVVRSVIDNEIIVFATDTFFIRPSDIPAATIWAIECNYVSDLIPANCPRADRLFTAHMSLETLLDALRANDLRKCREIHLLHISDDHGDESRFVREVEAATGIPTYAAPAYRRAGR